VKLDGEGDHPEGELAFPNRTGHWTAHNREHLVLLRPGRHGLILHALYYHDEVRAEEEFRTDSAPLSSPRARPVPPADLAAFETQVFELVAIDESGLLAVCHLHRGSRRSDFDLLRPTANF
jgi:hypothetical protein